MYKVFINDKEVRFLTDRGPLPTDGFQLNATVSPMEIVTRVQSAADAGIRTFYVAGGNHKKIFNDFLAAFPVIKAAGGVVRLSHPDGLILMIHRLGKWDLPKGKIDPGETNEDAALREVREECGIRDLKIEKNLPNTFHFYEFKGKWVIKMTYWFLMLSNDTTPPEPQTEEGITEVKWIREKDIYYLLPQTYASIADLLLNNVLHR